MAGYSFLGRFFRGGHLFKEDAYWKKYGIKLCYFAEED